MSTQTTSRPDSRGQRQTDPATGTNYVRENGQLDCPSGGRAVRDAREAVTERYTATAERREVDVQLPVPVLCASRPAPATWHPSAQSEGMEEPTETPMAKNPGDRPDQYGLRRLTPRPSQPVKPETPTSDSAERYRRKSFSIEWLVLLSEHTETAS